MRVSQKVKVRNAMGLHARPATIIARLLQNCKSKVFFTYRNETINAHSIMSLLMLAANKNAQILITVDGEDAEMTLHGLVKAFDNQFEEVVK